jgi:hypothetical protein
MRARTSYLYVLPIVRAPEAYRGLARTHSSSAVLKAKEREEEIIESGLTEELVMEVRIPQASETPAAHKATAIARARTTASSNTRVRGARNALHDSKSTRCRMLIEPSRRKSKPCTPSWSKWGSLALRFATLHAHVRTLTLHTHTFRTHMPLHMPTPTHPAYTRARGGLGKTGGRGGAHAFPHYPVFASVMRNGMI